MRFVKHILSTVAVMALGACGTTGGDTAANVVPISVNGSLCSANSYPNKLCVSVTVCSPGTSNCQTINDVLLDTGSVGLRLFKQVVTVPLTQVTSNSKNLTSCMGYADGTSSWGPVKTADVVLGGESAVSVPIQILDSTFGTYPTACGSSPDVSPSGAGFNGILGLGLYRYDCGSSCTSSTTSGIYYGCVGATCTTTTAALSKQLQNPIFLLPSDNNGFAITLPAPAIGGSDGLEGQLVLGIDTSDNNVPSGTTTFATNSQSKFLTVFNGTSRTAFIDTGSNALYFPPIGSTPDCAPYNPDYTGFYCPTSNVSLSGTTKGISGSPSKTISFKIGSFYKFYQMTAYSVFGELGGDSGDSNFDWGLPFYFGRTVYHGFDGKTSSIGSGAYWAY